MAQELYYGHDGIDINVPVDSGVTTLDAFKIVSIGTDGEIDVDGTKADALTLITQEPWAAATSPTAEVRCRVWGIAQVRIDAGVAAGDLVGPTGAKATTGQKVIGWCIAPSNAANGLGTIRIIQGGFTAA